MTPDTAGPRRTGRTGRPADRAREGHVLAAALEVLAERDYDRVTLETVATRAGTAKTTLYRRWGGKEDLVLDAIASVGRPPEADRLPEEGSLRADLIAITDSDWLGGVTSRLRVLGGLASAARHSARLADAVRTGITEPYVAAYRALLDRAVTRGVVSAELVDRLPLLALVVPTMSTEALTGAGGPVDRAHFVSVVDWILLPALGLPPED